MSNNIEIEDIRSRKKKNEHRYSNLAYNAKQISVRNKKIEIDVREYHILSTTMGRHMNLRSSPNKAYIVTPVIKIATVQ